MEFENLHITKSNYMFIRDKTDPLKSGMFSRSGRNTTLVSPSLATKEQELSSNFQKKVTKGFQRYKFELKLVSLKLNIVPLLTAQPRQDGKAVHGLPNPGK